MLTLIVRQGDYLARLARIHRFDGDAVWAHALNRKLSDEGRTPDILCPGDIIRVPDECLQLPHRILAGDTNRYVAKRKTVGVKIRLLSDKRPRVGVGYVVNGAGAQVDGTTGDDGIVAFDVPETVPEVQIVLKGTEVMTLRIGYLDPVTESSGVRERLRNLGYLRSYGRRNEGRVEVAAALREFQNEEQLDVTGDPSPETRERLVTRCGA